jgi:hypothetical protein
MLGEHVRHPCVPFLDAGYQMRLLVRVDRR